ncbi:hypothetical protein BU26DRAFT_158160 [Trematosphaeria pertusa]|uniref:Uncharacterized protein n=1 Tax=Trematosphaeria pertusa TaxID=390896 RepID=A0A6A6HWZ4_9PLEO|nr:uncharacterized protein BU26DRAFT_158160 [Trematosphaeria pertusa]KAF2242288.1 hypothetical protein BU26DRAFT_158160 [Trematosphaeria pertusa]
MRLPRGPLSNLSGGDSSHKELLDEEHHSVGPNAVSCANLQLQRPSTLAGWLGGPTGATQPRPLSAQRNPPQIQRAGLQTRPQSVFARTSAVSRSRLLQLRLVGGVRREQITALIYDGRGRPASQPMSAVCETRSSPRRSDDQVREIIFDFSLFAARLGKDFRQLNKIHID